MNDMLKSAAVGLLMLGVTSVAAVAADWNNGAGSYKDMRGSAAVPVPAPTPIPIYTPDWYLRADFGYGFGGNRDLSESGMQYGLLDSPGATGPTPFGMRSSWFNDDFGTFMTGGVGVGHYFSDRFRGDITFETVSMGKGTINGEERYDKYGYDAFYADNYGPSPHDAAGNARRRVTVYVSDVTKLTSYVGMANGYYDFGTVRGFTPYVGAGLGIAYHHANRKNTTNEQECDITAPCTSIDRGTYRGRTKETGYALAAAFTAGLSYSISEITALDFNYRYLHVGGTDVRLNLTDNNGTQHSTKVSTGDIGEHQLRAGLRFNIH